MSTVEPRLAPVLRAAAQKLIDERSIRDHDTLLGQLVASAVEMIPGALGVGISRSAEPGTSTGHATTSSVHDLDRLQSRLGQGPCLDAADDPPADGVVDARDLAGSDATRWPAFAPHAVSAGVRSILSVSLVGYRGGKRSALNFYSERPGAFDDGTITTAALFANQAAALLYGADNAAQLAVAVASRDVIGQAKGILIERFGLDGEEAFQMLVSSSQDANMKLRSVAEWLVKDTASAIAARRHGGDGPAR